MPLILSKYKHPSFILSVLVALGILSVLIYKASKTSFTHDEAFTYTHYVHQGFFDIISFKHPYLNNHILNSLLMKYSEMLFGKSELALRLPSILGFVIYSVFGLLWLFKICPRLILPCYILLVLNPYLLDFFILARGYGLSVGFLMASVYFISLYLETYSSKPLIYHHIAVLLAIFSNFSMLNYFVVSFVVLNLILLTNFYFVKKQFTRQQLISFYKVSAVCFIGYVVFLFEPIRRLTGITLLDFGGKEGFMMDTVRSIIYDVFYEQAVSDELLLILKSLSVVVFITGLIISGYMLFKKTVFLITQHVVLFYSSFLLFGMVSVSVLQHYIIGNDYYLHRFAIFYYVVFMINLCALLAYIHQRVASFVSVTLSALGAILLFINVSVNLPLHYFKDWKYDMSTKQVMQVLQQKQQEQPNKKIQLGVNWLFEPSTNFYRIIWDLKWLAPTHRNGISNTDDYLYLFLTDKEWQNYQHLPKLLENKVSNTVLVQQQSF